MGVFILQDMEMNDIRRFHQFRDFIEIVILDVGQVNIGVVIEPVFFRGGDQPARVVRISVDGIGKCNAHSGRIVIGNHQY